MAEHRPWSNSNRSRALPRPTPRKFVSFFFFPPSVSFHSSDKIWPRCRSLNPTRTHNLHCRVSLITWPDIIQQRFRYFIIFFFFLFIFFPFFVPRNLDNNEVKFVTLVLLIHYFFVLLYFFCIIFRRHILSILSILIERFSVLYKIIGVRCKGIL